MFARYKNIMRSKTDKKIVHTRQSLEDSNYPFNPLKKYLVLKIDKAVEQIDIRNDNPVDFASGYKLIRANFFIIVSPEAKVSLGTLH